MRRRWPAVAACVVACAGLAVLIPSLSAAYSHPSTGTPWKPLKGIDVSLSQAGRISDSRADQLANVLFSTISTKFHANAVSLNFSFWQSSSRSNDPIGNALTPSPGRLAAITAIAHKYHLAVQYRPLLYEKDLSDMSRPKITPTNPSLWFHNYWMFLEPYLVSANLAHAEGFSLAAELTSLMPYLGDWDTLAQQAKTVYSGTLFYSQQHDPQIGVPLTARGYDAYQPIKLASDKQVSVAAFTKGFEDNFRMVGMQSSPADLTAEEVGIPAVSKAYLEPNYYHYPPGTKVMRNIQADWFAGACNAFRTLHLKGMYFYSINLNTFTPAENNSHSLYNWVGTAAETAIANCYAQIRG